MARGHRGEAALAWVKQHNVPTMAAMSGERFEQMRADALDIFDSDTRIPGVGRHGDYLYNFWQDAAHPRGLWRRTTLEEYRKDSPEWDVVIDVDALAAAEDENWVWAGGDINAPGFAHAVVALSRGGGDASVVREFDMITREFVADGFQLPEANCSMAVHRGWAMILLISDWSRGETTHEAELRAHRRLRAAPRRNGRTAGGVRSRR